MRFLFTLDLLLKLKIRLFQLMLHFLEDSVFFFDREGILVKGRARFFYHDLELLTSVLDF